MRDLSDERAREEADRAVETLFNDFLRQSFEMLMPPDYTSMSSMKHFIAWRQALRKQVTASLMAAIHLDIDPNQLIL